MQATIEILGLRVFAYHGVLPEERERGQTFLIDVVLDVETQAVETDRLEDAVDYGAVAERVRERATSTRFDLIEALAKALADDLLERFPIARVRVRVRKPEVVLSAPVDEVAATVEAVRG